MFDGPLHPIAVHFPIAFAMLLPIVALGFLWAIRAKYLPAGSWLVVLLLHLLLIGSVYVAIELGEDDEEVAEQIVSGEAIETHEHWGERVMWATGLGLAVGVVSFFLTPLWMKLTYVAATAVIAGVVFQAGHTGGKLVYEHGAAEAHRLQLENLLPAAPEDGSEPDIYEDEEELWPEDDDLFEDDSK